MKSRSNNLSRGCQASFYWSFIGLRQGGVGKPEEVVDAVSKQGKERHNTGGITRGRQRKGRRSCADSRTEPRDAPGTGTAHSVSECCPPAAAARNSTAPRLGKNKLQPKRISTLQRWTLNRKGSCGFTWHLILRTWEVYLTCNQSSIRTAGTAWEEVRLKKEPVKPTHHFLERPWEEQCHNYNFALLVKYKLFCALK